MRQKTGDLTSPGWMIAGAIAALLLISVACIYVTDTHYASDHDGPKNAAKQCLFILAGLMIAAGILRIGYKEIARHGYVIFAIVLAALVPLLVARQMDSSFGGITAPRNGAYRWIRLPGFQLQPSEFMKIAIVLALARYLRYRKNYRRLGGLMLPFIIALVPLALILLEPDLGTALLFLPIIFAMLFMAGAKIRHLMLVVLVGLMLIPFAWGKLKSYQRLRVTAVMLQSERLRQEVIDHPERYRLLASRRQAIEWAASSGYQLVHSKNAIGSGGIFGRGWGKGVYVTNGLLPDRHNDFVLSIIGHQWGVCGCLFVLAAYAIITLAGLRIASATPEPVGRLLAVGVVALISSQVLINAGMAVGLLPITGMTLPFVSYGGSSLISNFIAVALLISVSQHHPYLLELRPFEYRKKPAEKQPLNDYPDGLPPLFEKP